MLIFNPPVTRQQLSAFKLVDMVSDLLTFKLRMGKKGDVECGVVVDTLVFQKLLI